MTKRTYFSYRKYLPLPTGGPVPVRTIELDGVKYDNVLGGEPGYVDLPQAESIVFTTAKLGSAGLTLHLYNFNSKQHILFEPAGVLAATGISGLGIVECEVCAYVDSFDGQTLVLGFKTSFAWFKMVFNLKTAHYEAMYRYEIDSTNTPAGATIPVFNATNVTQY